MTKLLEHIRHNAIAYLALFVALGGTSYAAIDVGDHSITPVKLSARLFGGYVRAWASVASSGRVSASTGGVNVAPQASAPAGDYIIHWQTTPTTACTAIANVDRRRIGSGSPLPGYALAEAARLARRKEESVVQTYNAQGQAAALPFDVALLCATPR